MIRVIVVDDEWYNLEEISDLVKGSEDMEVVGKYQNPVQALDEIADTMPDVAFLDIEMPEFDGLTLAERLLEKIPGLTVAFITSWNQYAVQAFDLNAIDYIMKPINMDRFERMIEKIRNDVNFRRTSRKVSQVKIQCFERFETRIEGIPVKWERSKAEELFAYLLIHHNTYINKNTIIENLWGDYEPRKALQNLQTSICRLRSIFSRLSDKITLHYSGNRYALLISNVECDYFEVEQSLEIYEVGNEDTYRYIEDSIMRLSKGLLTQQGYLWSMEKDEDIRRQFIPVLREIVHTLRGSGNMKKSIRFLKLLAVLTPYDDELNYQLIHQIRQWVSEEDAQKHYLWLTQVLKEEYDSAPSSRIQQLF